MGLMRFKVHDPSRLTREQAERAYMSGHDRVPWPSETYWTGDLVVIQRPVDDSGNFHIPWCVADHGEYVLGTATLREREAPYNLHVELARGKINLVRNQVSEWQGIGLAVPDRLNDRIKEASSFFAKAAANQHDLDVCVPLADQSLAAALDAANLLAACYADQALAARHRQDPQLDTHLGCSLGDEPLDDSASRQFKKAFNIAAAPLNWRRVEANEGKYDWKVCDDQIEWCEANDIAIWGGPILILENHCFPDWLRLWEDDFNTLMTFVSDYIETAVGRYKGKVTIWECAGRTNVGSALHLNEEQRLRLTVRAIETCRRVDPDAECVIRIDQPWAAYMTTNQWELSPIHFADALARAELGLTGVNLEINVGYYPHGTAIRDYLEFSRLLDLWSLLNLPLYITFTFPTSGEEDSKAFGEGKPIPNGIADGWSPLAQRNWVEGIMPLMLAKRSVAGVFWGQLSDAMPHEYPHGGLIDAAGKPKSALATLSTMRKYHLR
ncbi:MAG: endo-1,4-beta-xylanase [Planctomycetales bacterium]